jgi:hypothetical protein
MSPPDSTPARYFRHGVRVSAACNGVFLIFLYSMAFPTKDLRVRIPILLNVFGLTDWLTLMAFAWATGLVGLPSLAAGAGNL